MTPQLHNFHQGFRVPGRVKIFGCLMQLDKLNTRKNLHHKTILNSPFCPRCPQMIEDRRHLFFDCPTTHMVWQRGRLVPHRQVWHEIWLPPQSPALPPSAWPIVLPTLLWKIWDARNTLIFRDQVLCAQTSLSNVISDLSLWLYRFRKPSLKGEAILLGKGLAVRLPAVAHHDCRAPLLLSSGATQNGGPLLQK
jgi:hypothetical protein